MQQREACERESIGESTWTIALLFGGIVMIAGCAKQEPPPPPPPPEVTVSKPVVREVTDYFEFPGQTEAVGEVEIRARVTGYLDKVNFVDGQNVKKGDLLYEIDPRPYQAALDRAKGRLGAAAGAGRQGQGRLGAQRAAASLGRHQPRRVRAARGESRGSQGLDPVGRSRHPRRRTEPRIHENHLPHRRPRQPNANHRRQFGPAGDRAMPRVLTTVVTTNPIYVYFNIDEHVLLQYQEMALKTGQELHPDTSERPAIPGRDRFGRTKRGFPHAGILDFADNKIDRNTGTLRVRGVFENAKEYLTPGLFVRVRIPFGEPHRALLVSERAIGTDQRQKYLLTVNEENVVEYRRVKVGRLLDGMRVIESGIEARRPRGRQRIAAGAAEELRRCSRRSLQRTIAAADAAGSIDGRQCHRYCRQNQATN